MVQKITEVEINDCILQHDARNLQLKRRLVERGIDLRGKYEITCRFRAPNESQAALLEAELRRRGLRIVDSVPSVRTVSPRWRLVQAQIRQSLDQAASHEFTESMVRSAAGLSCVYEGWSSSPVS